MNHFELSTPAMAANTITTVSAQNRQRLHEEQQRQQLQQEKQLSVIMNNTQRPIELVRTISSQSVIGLPPSCDIHGISECCASSSPEIPITSRLVGENFRRGDREMNGCDAQGRIKRPMNAFMVWSQMRRAQIASTDVKMHNSQISKELGAEWRKMGAEEKAPYVARAKELREDLMRRHPNYVYRPKRKIHNSTRNIRLPYSVLSDSCTACAPRASVEQKGLCSGSQLPLGQDATQLFLTRFAQEQQKNIVLAAYREQLLAAASTTAHKSIAGLDSVEQEKSQLQKLRSAMANITTGSNAAAPDPFNFLSAFPMLQSQYNSLNPFLSPHFNPLLFGQIPQPASLPVTVPVAAQK